MVGFQIPHVILMGNLGTLLGNHLAKSPCLVMLSMMKVRLKAADCYYYPDLSVTCESSDVTGTEDFIHFPKLLIEVFSKATEAFDKGQKFTDYQTCPTLEEYVLVSQADRAIEVRSLIDGVWQIAHYQGNDRVTFHSIDWSGELAEIYRKVTLSTAPAS